MTREEAISVLRQELHYLNGGHAPNIYEYEDALDMAIAALKAQGNCCKKGNSWISVEDRLPKAGERVLTTDGAFVGEMYINKRGKWQRYNVNDSSLLMALDILWWMPLPPAPKEEV